jgi:hypothetical protein
MSGTSRSRLLHRQAVEAVHEPADLDVAEAARVRLAFDELLFMQLTLLVRRALSRCAYWNKGPWKHMLIKCLLVRTNPCFRAHCASSYDKIALLPSGDVARLLTCRQLRRAGRRATRRTWRATPSPTRPWWALRVRRCRSG